MPSAVEQAQGTEASSPSVQSASTDSASSAKATAYSAKAPSSSEPKVQMARGSGCPARRGPVDDIARTITRSPIRAASTPSPTAATWPQQSAPWMRGKAMPPPSHAPSALSASAKPEAPPSAVAPRTDFEYQAVRVLTSVLLIAAAATRISTSPGPGRGTGMSSRQASALSPPCPFSCQPRMVSGMSGWDMAAPFVGNLCGDRYGTGRPCASASCAA